MVKAQEYFDNKKKDVELTVNNKNLEGPLKLEKFTKLEKLYCPTNKITRLEINSCPNLRIITCRDNKLAELKFSKLKELSELYCEGNQLKELDVSTCLNLKKLDCSNNPLSNLNLKGLTKLEYLDISNTELDATILANLPESLEKITCLNKKNRKCQSLVKELKNYCEDPAKGIYNFKK
jgi:Leucine-rich repeat (LRR) protein